MLIEDVLYGSFDVDDEVLVELIKSSEVQRLKGISQRGYPKSTMMKSLTPPYYTRYEHSIGCMLLLRRIGAEIEEQIAGLLHDVSHTAFSHVVDWVMGDILKEGYQDTILSDYIKRSSVSRIIHNYGYDLEKISNMEHEGKFGLLEREAPDLCADRIDYAFRDSYNGYADRVRIAIEGIIVHNGEMIFDSRKAARAFGDCYVADMRDSYSAPENLIRYHLLSGALKNALEKQIITKDDLHADEEKVIAKIKSSKDTEATAMLDKALGLLNFKVTDDGIHLRYKLRFVDPKFMEDNKVKRLSSVDNEYASLIEEEKERHSRGVYIQME